MSQDNLKMVVQKSSFYRDNFQRMVKVLSVSIVINLAFLVMFFYLWHKEATYFVAVNDEGTIKEISLSLRPKVDDQMITNWVSKNVSQIYGLDFLNYRNQLLNMRALFTTQGWDSFNQAFKSTFEEIKQTKLVVSATLSGVPVITEEGYISGVQSWKVQVPMIVSYSSGNLVQNTNSLLQLTVQQQQSTTRLLGIAQIIQTIQSN